MPLITAANRKWWVVIAMSGLMILLTVDFFGITVALPRTWPARCGRRRPVPKGEHPTTAHPLWSSLWRRRRVPAGSTPGG